MEKKKYLKKMYRTKIPYFPYYWAPCKAPSSSRGAPCKVPRGICFPYNILIIGGLLQKEVSSPALVKNG